MARPKKPKGPAPEPAPEKPDDGVPAKVRKKVQQNVTLSLDDVTRLRLAAIGRHHGIRGESAVVRFLAAQEERRIEAAVPTHPPGDLIV